MKVVSSAKDLTAFLGSRIRLARKSAGLSQAALAHKLGVTAGAVAQWESFDGTRPGLERVIAMADVTQTSFEWLGTGRGDMGRKTALDGASALTLDAFAQDINEEILLDRFRRLSPRARSLLSNFLNTIPVREK